MLQENHVLGESRAKGAGRESTLSECHACLVVRRSLRLATAELLILLSTRHGALRTYTGGQRTAASAQPSRRVI